MRGVLMFVGSPVLRRRWMRTWPHLIDSTLFATGVWMAVNLHAHPGNSPWLGAKLVALAVYIALGFIALRHGRTRALRATAFVAALASFGYIVLVALRRSAWPF